MTFGWLLDLVPWWVWVSLAGGLLFLAWTQLGRQGLIAAIGAVIVAGAYIFGRKAGGAAAEAQRARERAEAQRERNEMDREATEAELRAGGMTDEEARTEAMKWARKR